MCMYISPTTSHREEKAKRKWQRRDGITFFLQFLSGFKGTEGGGGSFSSAGALGIPNRRDRAAKEKGGARTQNNSLSRLVFTNVTGGAARQ